MRNICTLIITSFLLFMAQFSMSQRSIVKSIDLEGTYSVMLAMKGNVTTTEWDKDYIRITVNIELTNSTDDILKNLIRLGRYSIISTINEGTLWLSMPKLKHVIIIKNQNLEEVFSYEVQLPKGVILDQEYTEDGTLNN